MVSRESFLVSIKTVQLPIPVQPQATPISQIATGNWTRDINSLLVAQVQGSVRPIPKFFASVP